MTAIPVDITLLEATKGPSIKLLTATAVHSSGAGAEYSGFAGLERLQLAVQARDLRGNTSRSLTVTVEHSDDGDSWETAATHEFTGNGTYRIEIDTPKDQLRTVWTAAGGLTRATLGPVTVSPGFLDETSDGGPQHLRVVLGPDELLTLKSAAVELVAAPDAGHLLWPLSLVLITAPGEVAYDVLNNVLLSWGPAPPGDSEITNNMSTDGAAQVVIEDVAADLYNNVGAVEVGVIAEQPLLLHSNDFSDSAVGDGTITVHLDYLTLQI